MPKSSKGLWLLSLQVLEDTEQEDDGEFQEEPVGCIDCIIKFKLRNEN